MELLLWAGLLLLVLGWPLLVVAVSVLRRRALGTAGLERHDDV